jgi:4-amino-4-deoxy-L-arabinose transferase-like glycosyltransferase
VSLFAVGFLLRAAYAFVATGPGAIPSSDTAEYDTVAWNLARGVGFALDGAGGPYPTAFVPPIVPWITSLLYRVVGHDYFAAVLLQCGVGALVPLLLAAFGGTVFGSAIGRTAGWLAALHPLLVFFSGYLLTETTFSAVLLLALLATVQWIRTPRAGRALGVGVLWGLASLTRPTALALPLLVGAWAWVPLGLTVGPAARPRHVLLLLLGVGLVVAPWTLRNAAQLHAFVPVTTGGGRALLDSNNPVNWSDPARRGGAQSVFGLEPWASEFRGRPEPEVDAMARRHALAFLAGHWREWPAMAGAKLARFWRVTTEGGGTGAWQREGSPLTAVLRRVDPLLVWSLFALPLALVGAWRTLRGPRRWYQSLGLLVILYFSALAVVFWGSLRMRVPVEPLVTLFAAVGFEDVRRRLRGRLRGMRVVEGRRAA